MAPLERAACVREAQIGNAAAASHLLLVARCFNASCAGATPCRLLIGASTTLPQEEIKSANSSLAVDGLEGPERFYLDKALTK